jgi:hypothetical protein
VEGNLFPLLGMQVLIWLAGDPENFMELTEIPASY